MSQPDTANDLDNIANTPGSEKTEKDRNSKSKGSSKSKDLSHVPCKFYRVGSCTAGSSCPFSHNTAEPGQPKEPCAWFMKGNCKFGHKCALAHILPGQPMSMDRRNKKTAQLAAGQANSNGREKDSKQRDGAGRVDKTKSSSQRTAGVGLGQVRNGLLTGPTAPTRVLPTGARPPMSISKAAPAPPATAPTLQDADFTSFDVSKQSGPSGPKNEQAPVELVLSSRDQVVESPNHPNFNGLSPPSQSPFIPISSPKEPVRFTGRHGTSPSMDFGPVGSPPRASPSNPIRINGFSPGTSPLGPSHNATPLAAPTSTFSAPGPSTAQSLFMQFERNSVHHLGDEAAKSRSGLAASLGAFDSLNFAPSAASMSHKTSSNSTFSSGVVDDLLDVDDMEEFVPSSLKDLLTPEEQMRRFSRASSNTGVKAMSPPFVRSGSGLQDGQHRYSRSVPGQSIMQDIRSIWAEPSTPNNIGQHHPYPYDAEQQSQHLIASGLGIGVPSSSFKASSLLKAAYDEGPSPSMLSPSNASAAFLPGVHHQLLSRGAPRGGFANMSARSVSHGHVPVQLPSGLSHESGKEFFNSQHRLPPSSLSSGHTLSNFDQSLPRDNGINPLHPSGRPIPSSGAGYQTSDMSLFSPSARALQTHAPGESLPQGLAAGYSRIHLQPPPNSNPSPSAFSPGTVGMGAVGSPSRTDMDNSSGLDWRSLTPASKQVMPTSTITESATVASPPPHTSAQQQHSPSIHDGSATSKTSDAEVGGLSSMFSRLSYSAAAARGTAAATSSTNSSVGGGVSNAPTSAGVVPMSMARRPSGRSWNSHPLSSPLSGPVISHDDEEVFTLDEEK